MAVRFWVFFDFLVLAFPLGLGSWSLGGIPFEIVRVVIVIAVVGWVLKFLFAKSATAVFGYALIIVLSCSEKNRKSMFVPHNVDYKGFIMSKKTATFEGGRTG